MNHTAAKYFKIGLIEFKKFNEYKFDFILGLLRIPVHVFILLALWYAIFKVSGQQMIAGMDIETFATYIIIARLISYCQKPWDLYETMRDYIQKGKVALYLARPVHFSRMVFARAYSYTLIFMIPVILILIAGNFLPIDYFFPTPLFFALFIVSFILSLALGFMIYYAITLSMVWVGDVWSVWGIWDGIQGLLSGELIPLTISAGFYTVASYFPFMYMTFVPVFIYLQKYTLAEAVMQIGIQILWILGFAILCAFILKKALRKMDNQGG